MWIFFSIKTDRKHWQQPKTFKRIHFHTAQLHSHCTRKWPKSFLTEKAESDASVQTELKEQISYRSIWNKKGRTGPGSNIKGPVLQDYGTFICLGFEKLQTQMPTQLTLNTFQLITWHILFGIHTALTFYCILCPFDLSARILVNILSLLDWRGICVVPLFHGSMVESYPVLYCILLNLIFLYFLQVQYRCAYSLRLWGWVKWED